jgi:hypothetical protein
MIPVNPNKITNYTTMWAQVVVTHATSYDVLLGSLALYPIGVTIDFSEETTYYRPSWQIGNSHKASLPMRFIRGQIGKSIKSTMLVGFSGLPHGFELLEVMSMTKMHFLMVNWRC